MKKILFLFWLTSILGFVRHSAQAALVDTVVTYSAAMKKNIKAVVVRPDNYTTKSSWPVVYLLHGYSGNYADWITKVRTLGALSDQLQLLIVCADGGYSSWYWNSPRDSAFQYETYVSQELVQWIDAHFNTIRQPAGRAITGLSMGGHGALYLAFKHQDIFGAAGSMSGGVDIRPFPLNWDMALRLGSYAEAPANWESHTVINLLHLVKPNKLAILIDCGTEDFFYSVNQALHNELLYRNIPHDFITRPGAHNWTYWTNALPYQLLFMQQFFSKNTR